MTIYSILFSLSFIFKPRYAVEEELDLLLKTEELDLLLKTETYHIIGKQERDTKSMSRPTLLIINLNKSYYEL